MTKQEVIESYHSKIISKLHSEGLSLQSDWQDIEACMAKTVMPKKNIQTAKELKYGISY